MLFVSHNLTNQRIKEDKAGGSARVSPPIVLRQRPNKKIIHEMYLLNYDVRLQVIKILIQPNYDGEIRSMSCFLPHHSVLLIKNGKTSSIEICFACQKLQASKGIGISDIHYSKKMWAEFENLFLKSGIKYQIPFNLREK